MTVDTTIYKLYHARLLRLKSFSFFKLVLFSTLGALSNPTFFYQNFHINKSYFHSIVKLPTQSIILLQKVIYRDTYREKVLAWQLYPSIELERPHKRIRFPKYANPHVPA